MYLGTILDELEKLGAISPEQARRSLDRLDVLESSKPTGGQVMRYGALGAATAPVLGMVSNVIRKKPALEGKMVADKVRSAAADATRGALGMGALPLVRGQLDQRAEMGTLKKFLKENTPQ